MPQPSRFTTVGDYFQRYCHFKAALHKHLGLLTELQSDKQLLVLDITLHEGSVQ